MRKAITSKNCFLVYFNEMAKKIEPVELVRYFLAYEKYSLLSAFKFVLFPFGGLRPLNPPPGLRPRTPENVLGSERVRDTRFGYPNIFGYSKAF